MSRLLTKKQVLMIVPYCNTHLLRLERDGKFPKRIKPGGTLKSKAFWVEEEVSHEANLLILRHYTTESSILNFLIDNTP